MRRFPKSSPLRDSQKGYGTLEISRLGSESGDEKSARLNGGPDASRQPSGADERLAELSARDMQSTNKLYNNIPGKGRRKTARYKRWLFTAGWELRLQKIQPLPGRVHLEICLPDRPGRAPDADNVLKAIIDLLVRHHVIDGDDKKVVRSVTVRWDESSELVRITIRAADQPIQTAEFASEGENTLSRAQEVSR